MSAVIFAAVFAIAWCLVRVADRWLDRKEAEQRLARRKARQTTYTRSDPRR